MAVSAELVSLGFLTSAFTVEIKNAPAGPDGADEALFLFAPNTGEEPRRLAKIASGGELSRVLLAVKNALRDGAVQTLVFDEVDAGIGGTVAEKVGERLAALAGDCQVICITHLPQIASMTRNHMVVEKRESGGRTVTGVRKLAGEERVAELARMLGSAEKSNAAYVHAAKLAERCAN
ncbi:hypothetical protein FDZ71_05920 [bacterium]|nr:MAG: hypothetical protein FDZ71_05920 [bacterium]